MVRERLRATESLNIDRPSSSVLYCVPGELTLLLRPNNIESASAGAPAMAQAVESLIEQVPELKELLLPDPIGDSQPVPMPDSEFVIQTIRTHSWADDLADLFDDTDLTDAGKEAVREVFLAVRAVHAKISEQLVQDQLITRDQLISLEVPGSQLGVHQFYELSDPRAFRGMELGPFNLASISPQWLTGPHV
jgi:hypothetical protein